MYVILRRQFINVKTGSLPPLMATSYSQNHSEAGKAVFHVAVSQTEQEKLVPLCC